MTILLKVPIENKQSLPHNGMNPTSHVRSPAPKNGRHHKEKVTRVYSACLLEMQASGPRMEEIASLSHLLIFLVSFSPVFWSELHSERGNSIRKKLFGRPFHNFPLDEDLCCWSRPPDRLTLVRSGLVSLLLSSPANLLPLGISTQLSFHHRLASSICFPQLEFQSVSSDWLRASSPPQSDPLVMFSSRAE